MPERHLGLITAEERLIDENNITRLCEWLEQGLDTDRLIEALPEIKDLETGGRPPMEKTTANGSGWAWPGMKPFVFIIRKIFAV